MNVHSQWNVVGDINIKILTKEKLAIATFFNILPAIILRSKQLICLKLKPFDKLMLEHR